MKVLTWNISPTRSPYARARTAAPVLLRRYLKGTRHDAYRLNIPVVLARYAK